jgi:hypothetical protein
MLGSVRRLPILLLTGALVAALGGTQGGTATAAPPAPVEIRLEAITSAVTAPAGTPATAVPLVLAVAKQELTVKVSFWDAAGRAASFSKDTRIAVTLDGGTVTSIDTLARKNSVTADLKVSVPVPGNQLRLRVAFSSGKVTYSDVATDLQRFDVLSQLRFEAAAPGQAFAAGIGGRDDCSEATAQDPVCGIVILPRGAASSQVLLSLGPCEPDPDPGAPPVEDYSGCGDERGSVVQALAHLEGYTTTSPATILMKCDKTLCGGGAIQALRLSYTLTGNGALTTAGACPAKGTLGAEPACVDYVQSKRDGSGDTFLYLLLLEDARVSVG